MTPPVRLPAPLPAPTLHPARLTAPVYPAPEGLRALWDACLPLDAPGAALTARYLEARGLDPGLIARCDLARHLPLGAPAVPWAMTRAGRSWHDVGVRLLVPLVDEGGAVVSVVGRVLDGAGEIKTLLPLDMSARGLCFASPLDRDWLARMGVAAIDIDAPAPRPPELVLVVEGEMDYLTWAQALLRRVPKPPPPDSPRAPVPGHVLLLGVRAGSFGPAWAGALRGLTADAPPPVCLRLHHDGAGNAYALKVGMHLRSEGFGLITRSVPYAQADWDENDAAREQALPLDPMSGTLDFVPSLAVPGATLDAKNGQVLTDEELMEAHRLRAEAAGLLDRARTAPDLEAVLTQRRAYFDGACARAASAVAAARQGGRNRSLFVEAAGLARFRYEPDLCVTRATLGDVLAVPARACGLSDAEARATLDSAWRRGDGARYKPPMPEHLSLDDETRRLARAARAVERGQASGPPRPGHVRSQRTRDAEVDGDGVVVEGPRAPLTDAEAAQVEVEVREVGGAVLRAACGGRVRLDVRDYDFDLQESRIYAALAAKSVRVYQRDGVLMRQEDASGDMPSHLRPVPVEVLETEISSVVTWYKERTDRMGRTHEDGAPMPARYPRALVQRRHHPGIREARFLLTHPATVGGRLVLREGYDAASRTLYLPTRPVVIPPVKEAPTKDEARAALRELVSVFDEFVFEGAGGLSAALSLLLTQLARPEVETEFVPYYLITTTTPGTGKGTLVEAINGIVEGTTGLYPARPSSSLEEEHKQYMTWAMGGRSGMVYFDNIKSGTSVGSPALDAILTGGGRIEGRKLGANENYQGRLSVTFVGTGNNVSISGDLARRLVIIRLALPPGVSPAARTFKRDLRAYVLAERPRLLHAAFTVMAAYRAAGSPLDKTLRPHPSFSEWSRVARNPLVWLGMPDPVEEAQRQAGSADLQVVYLRELLSALHTISKGAPFTAHHLCRYWKEACEESDALSEQLVVACEQLDFADGARWNKARVTATLGAYQGRAFDGYALMVDQPFVRWRAERAQ